MFTLNSRGRLLLIDRPIIMGILNRTSDSFYSGSRVREDDALLEHADRMIGEGADWLDIGGQSTRPGAETVGAEEELQRIIGAIDLI
ncbi:MAG TPA: dihydropteroate synthase, partial [Puia sp.]|nr:dihydropteroate synthase [Puia sp.]